MRQGSIFEAKIAPGFEQTVGDVFQGTQSFGEGASKGRAFGHELKEEQGNLQEQVEDFVSRFVLAKDVFQGKATVFLEVEALILNFPAQPTSLIGNGGRIGGEQGEIGQPFELGRLLPLGGNRFDTLQNVERMAPIVTISVGDAIHPAIDLPNAFV